MQADPLGSAKTMSEDLSFQHVYQPPTSERSDSPTLLVLHGTGGSEMDLLPLARTLAPQAGVLSPRGKVLERGMPRFFRRLAEGVFDEEDLRFRAGELADFDVIRPGGGEHELQVGVEEGGAAASRRGSDLRGPSAPDVCRRGGGALRSEADPTVMRRMKKIPEPASVRAPGIHAREQGVPDEPLADEQLDARARSAEIADHDADRAAGRCAAEVVGVLLLDRGHPRRRRGEHRLRLVVRINAHLHLRGLATARVAASPAGLPGGCAVITLPRPISRPSAARNIRIRWVTITPPIQIRDMMK